MKRSVNNLKSNQPEMLSKRAEKKRVNLPWNHSLFFQIGLIVSLLAVFFIMESSFELKNPHRTPTDTSSLDEPITIHKYVIDVPKVLKQVKRTIIKEPKMNTTRPISTLLEVVSNNSEADETKIILSDNTIVPKLPTILNPKVLVNNNPKNMNSVEFVPIFPGCEMLSSNKQRVVCMSSKIGAFIKRNFRTAKFDYLESEKIHSVYVSFKINSEGDITNIKARAANSKLEEEGKRVIGKLPKMKPGKQGDVPVDVMYSVPIVFKINL